MSRAKKELVDVELMEAATAALWDRMALWDRIMTTFLPDELVDCGNSKIEQIAKAIGCDTVFKRRANAKRV